MGKRVLFKESYQRKFLETIKEKANVNWGELAQRLNIKKGTLKSYRYEYCSLPFEIFRRVIQIAKYSKTQVLLKFNAKIEDEFYVNTFARPLGSSRVNTRQIKIKYTKNSLNLDTSNVKFSKNDKEREIKLPSGITPELAEEVGAHLGDGFLSNRGYEYRLKGGKDEIEYYEKYIKPLFKRLFNLKINTRAYETTYGFELSSKALWGFKTKVLSIPAGKKTDIRVPDRLKINNIPILCALVRGYFDTDGWINLKSAYGYVRYYPEIGVESASKPLISDFKEILLMLGFNVRTYTTKDGYSIIMLRGYENLKKYYELIGWSNPKQRKKVEEWAKTYPEICRKIGFYPQFLYTPNTRCSYD